MEKAALEEFYSSTDGPNWRTNENWLTGDPCLNYWYGVMCNKFGQVISIHLFENSLTGVIPDSIVDLTYLTTFNIFNDGREYEGVDNVYKNTITTWNPKIHELMLLQEINFMYLDMTGTIDVTFNNLVKLRAINLTKNLLSGSLPDNFSNMPALEYIQLSFNDFSGSIPTSLIGLQKLKFIEITNNQLAGAIPIITSQELYAIDLTSNSLSGDFPMEYFSTTSYPKLQYVNANLNNIAMPSHCLQYVYCFKDVLNNMEDGDIIATLDEATKTLINSATDVEVEAEIQF